jgi:hypothetical protein
VRDKSDLPVIGSNIYIEGTYDGTSSDEQGMFHFTTPVNGKVVLKITYIGFDDYDQEIELAGNPIILDVTLVEAINRLEAVVITAGSFEAGSQHKSEVLRPLDIVTTAGATADIPGALNTLPGTQTVGEEGRLFVRGGDGYETITFIDGLAVQESYDITAPNVPTRSRFSPFMFSGASFSTGGYSAEFGQGLSSALILNTKETASETRSDFSFISVGLEAAHAQMWEKASLSGKIGYFNLDPYFTILKQDIDWINPPTSFDGNLAYRQQIGEHGMLKSYGKFNLSELAFNQEPFEIITNPVNTHIQNQYGYLNTSYQDILSKKWMFRSGISYTSSHDDIGLNDDRVSEHNRGFHGKVVAGYEPNDRIFMQMGTEIISRSHSQDFTEFETGFENRFDFAENILSTFLESDLYFSQALVARVGGRMEYNGLSRSISLDPRLSLALKTGDDSQISWAYGHFRQAPPKDLLRVANLLESERAVHMIANYQWMKKKRIFRVEAYWKQYKDLVTFYPSLLNQSASYKNAGDGHARGFDVFFRDGNTFPNVDYWLSYSYLDTERKYRDFPYSAAPVFTSKHNFSAVYKHFVGSLRTQFGFTYAFASGRPYNDPNTSEFNGRLTPAYHDLSTNISFLAKSNIIVYVSITNVLNRTNIFGYEFRDKPDEQGVYQSRPITLPAPRFMLLGVFVTLSKSSTMNQLPHL